MPKTEYPEASEMTCNGLNLWNDIDPHPWQEPSQEGQFCSKDEAILIDDEKDEGLDDLLDCMWLKESSRGKNMVGDSGLAIGHYQIHIDIHPVSYDCAMDFYCSRDYTRMMILKGLGYLWTSYHKCL